MSWIIEPNNKDSKFMSLQSGAFTSLKKVGGGMLLPSLDLLPNDFNGRIWPNTVFTVPHDDDIGAASVASAEPNWGIADLMANALWEIGARGKGIKVGIADSGIDVTHPCLSNIAIPIGNFAVFGLSDGQNIAMPPSDSGWHGTHCAGVIFGQEQTGVYRGISPEAIPCIARVLDGWNGSVASIKNGLDWLRKQQCDVISLSLGWPGLHDEWATEIRNLVQSGAIVIAASGNEYGISGSAPTRSPANYPVSNLISVGAYDRTRSIWVRSGGGEILWPQDSQFGGTSTHVTPHLVGPGVDIVSSTPNGGYRSADGTSMATPHIAGLLACVLSYLKERGIKEPQKIALNMLTQSLVDLGATGEDIRYGKGAVDSHKLITALKQV